VRIVNGFERNKLTEFGSALQFEYWYEYQYENSSVQLEKYEGNSQVFSLVTCSYSYFSNERTVVYAVEVYRQEGSGL
jgi:sortase B